MLYAIGDIHGRHAEYERLLEKIHKEDKNAVTVQVGDHGIGFDETPVFPSYGESDFFFAGNHDDRMVCAKSPHYLGHFGHKKIAEHEFFFAGGAYSIDRRYRILGKTYWDYEELSYSEFSDAQNLALKVQPDIVLSHDCPTIVNKYIYSHHREEKSRTNQGLQEILNNCFPKVWCHGHHHVSFRKQILGTLFVCIPELSYVNVTQLLQERMENETI